MPAGSAPNPAHSPEEAIRAEIVAALLALGYSGWGPGQLEREIRRNDWIVADAPADLVFSPDAAGKWAAMLRHNGIDPVSLSVTGGRA